MPLTTTPTRRSPLRSFRLTTAAALAAALAFAALPSAGAQETAPGAKPAAAASAAAAPASKPHHPEPLPADAKRAYDSIRGDRIVSTIRFLASPRLEGREAGERGLEIAADYLVSRLQAAGLSAGTKEGFLERWNLRWRTPAATSSMELVRRASGASELHRPLELKKEWAPFSFSEPGEVDAPVVFAGYGIVAPEEKWDDYAPLGKDGVRGKIVVVFRHEPDEEGSRGAGFFDGREMTLHASLRQKAREAASRGAIGLVVVDDPLNHEARLAPSSPLSRWTILSDADRKLAKDDPKRPRPWPSNEDADAPLGIVAVQASQELLRFLAPGRDWKGIQRQLDEGHHPGSLVEPGTTIDVTVAFDTDLAETANVVALLPGSDPVLSKEYVLVGGHLDHLGKDRRSGEIHPGADDNGSGSAATLAVAEAFASLAKAPARSLLFCFWSGEEEGLLGSDAFVHHPPVPLEKIVAAINLDMVGRNKEGEMSVVGRPETPDLVELFDRFAPEVGFALNDDAGAGASRSDNGSLWLAGIPTASLFSGLHEDYHEPSDTPEKIVPGKVEKAARLSFLVAREIADGRATPKPLDVPAGAWTPIAPKRADGDAASKTTPARGAGREAK